MRSICYSRLRTLKTRRMAAQCTSIINDLGRTVSDPYRFIATSKISTYFASTLLSDADDVLSAHPCRICIDSIAPTTR
uniref:Uncharacterized protein n=1 Tax=Pararge aegeria TaxID=116150 RepID=S4PVZ6_9NEOP